MSAPPKSSAPGGASPQVLRWLGWAGAVPLVATTLAAWFAPHPYNAIALNFGIGYGAILFTYQGGIRCGALFADAAHRAVTPASTPLAWALLPALLAWVVLLVDLTWGVFLLASGFIALQARDRQVARMRLHQGWWPSDPAGPVLVVVAALLALLLRLVFDG